MAYGDNNQNQQDLERQKFEADKARFNAEQNAKAAQVPQVHTTPANRPIVPGQATGDYVPRPARGVPQAIPPSIDIPQGGVPQAQMPSVVDSLPSQRGPNPYEGTKFAGAGAAPIVPGTKPPATPVPAIDHKMSDLQWNRVEKYNPENRTPFHDLGKAGKFGRIASTIGNVAGDIFAPATMALIPGTQLHNAMEERRAERGYEAAQQGEREAALAQRALREPVNKIVGHYVNENGQQVWKRESGQEETSGETYKKPEYQMVQNQKGPNGEAISGMVDKNDPKWTGKEQDFAGHNIGDYKFVASGQETARPGSGTGQYKMVPTGADTEAMADFSKPSGGRPYTIVSPSKKTGTSSIWIDPNDPTHAKLLDNKTGEFSEPHNKEGQTGNAASGGTMPTAAYRGYTQKFNTFQHNFEKPAQDTYQQYRKFLEADKMFHNNPQTGASGMTEWAMHMGATFGSIAHTTQGEKMAEYHKNALPLFLRAEQFYNEHVVNGQPITPEQAEEFGSLIKATMQIQFQTNAREAQAQNFPVKTIPRDVMIDMRTASGKVIPVAGDKVQEAIENHLMVE